MALYGIGCMYDDEDVCPKFHKKGIACIGWSPEDKPYLYGILREISIGDIIILKSFFPRGGQQVLRIKAVGIVINDNVEVIKDLGHCLKVKWISYDADGIKEHEFPSGKSDAGVQRGTTIYKEYNPEICKQIVDLMLADLGAFVQKDAEGFV